MNPKIISPLLFLLPILLYTATALHAPSSGRSSIVFATLGSRSSNAYDIFTLPISVDDPPNSSNELRITDGQSLNFNGHFPSSSSFNTLLSLLPNQTHIQNFNTASSVGLVYVTERGGTSSIYFDVVYGSSSRSTRLLRSALEIPTRVQVELLKGNNGVSMKDKPTVTGDYLVYVSTHEDVGKPRTSWAAVYSTELKTGLTRRLTPHGIADFSPAVSPSGIYTAVASYGEKGWDGEVEMLSTDIYVFLTRDGTHRVKIVENGGWPSWVDDSTIYFHRRSEESWISVYRAILPRNSNTPISTDSVVIERVTPPGLHAFTPATSPGNHKFIAVATRRPNSDYRHIELFDLVKKEFTELTRLVAPNAHHFNPFISPDSNRIGYHRCRGASNDKKGSTQFMLENLKSPVPEISLFRIDGSFPSWSPSGDRIAFVQFPGVYVVNRDGSNRRQVYPGNAFGTIWNPVRPGVVYTSAGPEFSSTSANVNIVSINVDQGSFKKLTTNGINNAFPAVSPDGNSICFRSSKTGYKNLYIMDADKGEEGGLFRLTEGPWDDTMANWSPDGEWITFASDRENPGSGSFELFLIHPNGTGLKKLVQSGLGGRTNHPYFSPDGKSLVFTTDYAGISAEPISNSHHYQPYGEIYTIKLDGSGLKRLTHNSFEDGTPAWGPVYIEPEDLKWTNYGPQSCAFEDCHWLNDMPKQSVKVRTMALAKRQCRA